MKKFIPALALAIAAVSSPAFAAANSSSDTATGSVTIIQPLTVAKTADLAFGRVVQPTSGSGTVAIAHNSSSVVAASGAVALSGITTSHAAFSVSGEGAQVVNISMPTSFNLVNGSNSIAVTLDPDWNTTSNQVTLSGSLGAAGSATLNVGGHFSLPSSQASGAYTGTFTVTAAYN